MRDGTFRFEKLAVWQKATVFAKQVYNATQSFPQTERFALTSQMRQAAVSVSSNIAEGTSRSSGVDFSRFLEIAYGSVIEVVSQAAIARELGYLKQGDFVGLRQAAEELTRMLSGLRSSILKPKA